MGPKVYYHVREISPLIATLNQINSAHSIPSYLFHIHLNIIFPSTTMPSKWSFHVSQPNPSAIYPPPQTLPLFCPPNYIWWLRYNHAVYHYNVLNSLLILPPSTRTYTTLNGGVCTSTGVELRCLTSRERSLVVLMLHSEEILISILGPNMGYSD
jgi:hypothetical protein